MACASAPGGGPAGRQPRGSSTVEAGRRTLRRRRKSTDRFRATRNRPRQELVAGRPLAARLVEPHEDLLREVAGVLAITRVAVGQGEYPPLQLADERLPGHAVAGPASLDEWCEVARVHLC